MKKITTLGQRLKKARLASNFTQQALAEECGWSHQTRIANYENDTREPRIIDISRLCEVLNITTQWLQFGDTK